MKTWKEFKNYNNERNFLNLSTHTHTQILILFNLIIFIAHIHSLSHSPLLAS